MDGQNFQNEQNKINEYTTYTQPQTVIVEQPKQSNALAIVSLVLGILSIVSCCCIGWIGLFLAIGGIVCAAIARKKNPTGIAMAGLICSIVGIGFSLVSICFSTAFSAAFMEAFMEEMDSAGYYY